MKNTTRPFDTPDRFQVLFVCMGNICRSPTAHGVFQQRIEHAGLASRVRVASAATHDYHPGEPPDRRSIAHARRRGYDLSDLRARFLTGEALADADLVLVMDEQNLRAVHDRCAPQQRDKVRRLTEFCRTHRAQVVPDPYYGGADAFEHVLDLVEDACDGLIETVRRRLRG